MMEKSNVRPSPAKKILSDYQKAHKRAERERSRLFKEHQKEQEKKEKLLLKEKERLEKQEKKDAEEREKELKRLKRKEEQKKKEEEKENERKKKEEEKRKKEEERVQRESEKKKEEESKTKREEKQRAVLLGFLVKTDTKKDTTTVVNNTCGPFIQFEIRKDMRMAPLHRMTPELLQEKRDNLDRLRDLWNSESNSTLVPSLGLRMFGKTNYLHELRTGQLKPLHYPSTWPTEPPSVQYLGESLCLPINSQSLKQHGTRGTGGTVWLRAKLFQFVENYRPAYYGTWRRTSCMVTGRRPFLRDEFQLDYSVDSDDEWEEEEPGESITQSDNEEEEEEKEDDDEDDDDRFFVPHGYLSDDEGVGADEGEGPVPDEIKKLRQRLSVAEYEAAHRRGLQRLKPMLFGPIWLSDPTEYASNEMRPNNSNNLDDNKENIELIVSSESNRSSVTKTELQVMRSLLSVYRIHLWTNSLPISIQTDVLPTNTPFSKRLKKSLPDEAIPYLIHLVHLSPLSKHKLAFEFRVFWHKHTTGSLPECTRYDDYKRYNASLVGPSSARAAILSGPAWDNLVLSQSIVLSKLTEIAVFEEGRWAVHSEIIQQFGSRLFDLCGIQELNKLPSNVDKEFLSKLNFPTWQFLTDVSAITVRSNRCGTSKRRSLEVVHSKETSKPNQQLPETIVSTAVVVLHPLGNLSSINNHKEMNITKYDSLPEESPTVMDTSLPIAPIETSISVRNDTTSSQPVNSNPTPTRKRVTLDSFFIPPAKRQITVGEHTGASINECILIDSD